MFIQLSAVNQKLGSDEVLRLSKCLNQQLLNITLEPNDFVKTKIYTLESSVKNQFMDLFADYTT